MTTNRWFLAGAAMLFAMTTAAQGSYIEDDIYAPKRALPKAPKVQQTVSRPSNTIIVATEDPATVAIRSHSDRDVDEYNRRVEPEGQRIESNSSAAASQEFSATERINRFYKKGITIEVDDPDNTNIYVLNSNDYNIYVSNRNSYWNTPYYGWNSPYYWNSWGWGGFYSSWAVWSPFYWGGWYSPWYDPWYGPHYWGGGWGPYYPVYHHHYYSSSPYRYYSNGRASRGSDGGYYGRSSSSYSERGRVSSSGGRGTRDNSYSGYSSSRSGTTRNTINQSEGTSGRRTREVMTRESVNNRTYDNRNSGNVNTERRTRSTIDNSNTNPSRSTISTPRSSGFGSGGASTGGGSIGGGGGASSSGGRGRR